MTEESRKLMGDQSTQLALNVLYCIVLYRLCCSTFMTEEARKLMGDQSTQLALNVLYCIVSLVLQYVYDRGIP